MSVELEDLTYQAKTALTDKVWEQINVRRWAIEMAHQFSKGDADHLIKEAKKLEAFVKRGEI